MLDQEFQYYKSHQDELVAKYHGKYIVVVGDQVEGAFEDELDAYLTTKKKHEVGTFLIQHCLPGAISYTQTFHSRVTFA